MLTGQGLLQIVNKIKQPVYHTHGLRVEVEIRDVRRCWARVDFLIVPMAGTGETWVSAEYVTDGAGVTA